MIRSKRRTKSISIQVRPDGVQVRAPLQTPESTIISLLKERQDWVVRQWQAVHQSTSGASSWPPRHMLLHGTQVPLRILEDPAASGWTVCLQPDAIVISGPGASSILEQRQAVADRFKVLARRYIPPRVNFWAQRLGLSFGTIRIKGHKSRWGSCSRAGNLNFNWRLVQASDEVLDYVIVHELCHLIEMNHSPRFWKLVQDAYPRQEAARLWLKTYGSTLFYI